MPFQAKSQTIERGGRNDWIQVADFIWHVTLDISYNGLSWPELAHALCLQTLWHHYSSFFYLAKMNHCLPSWYQTLITELYSIVHVLNRHQSSQCTFVDTWYHTILLPDITFTENIKIWERGTGEFLPRHKNALYY